MKRVLICGFTDNVGGMEDYLIPKIYKQPINSSKGKWLGEGTIHSAYFIGILNGTIKAQNVFMKKDKGLRTDILLPIYKGK